MIRLPTRPLRFHNSLERRRAKPAVSPESGFAGLWDSQDSHGARLDAASAHPNPRWRSFRLWRKAQSGRNEILKIPPFPRIPILTNERPTYPPTFHAKAVCREARFSPWAIFQNRINPSKFPIDKRLIHVILFLCSCASRRRQPTSPQKKEGISVSDWKARAVGDRSCICTEQFRNRDCDAVGDSTDPIPVLGIRAEASFTSPASRFPEHTPALFPRIGTSVAVSRSRMFVGSASGRGERDWLDAISVPPPPPRIAG